MSKDFINSYSNGRFDPELFYVTVYQKIPSRYELCIEDDEHELFVPDANINEIKKLFTSEPFIRTYNYSNLEDKDSFLDSTEGFEKSLLSDTGLDNEFCGNIVMTSNELLIIIRYNNIAILYNPNLYTTDAIKSMSNKVFNLVPSRPKESLACKLSFIKVANGDYYTITKDVDRFSMDVSKNYNDDFLPVFEDLKKFLDNEGNGLALLHGPAGTGKTSVLKHLISNCPHEYIVIPNNIASRLGDPELTDFITDHENSVFILEDCEQLIEDRSTNMFNNAIATILGMTDGLYGLVTHVKFICTFNADITKIDSALLRKGRCKAKYKFGKLCAEKVSVLNDEYKIGITDIKPMTLAEIFNYGDTDYSEKENANKLGF